MAQQDNGIAIRIEGCLTPYAEGLRLQRELHAARCAGEIGDTILFVEHAPVYTLGRSSEAGSKTFISSTARMKQASWVDMKALADGFALCGSSSSLGKEKIS